MEDQTAQLVQLMQEFTQLYKLINRNKINEILQNELRTPQLIEMYRLTDGVLATREVAAVMQNKCSHVTVANTWKRWALAGIVVPTVIKGRYKAIFNLEEYGIIDIKESE